MSGYESRKLWTPKDIVERTWPECKTVVEFWKDDVKVSCPNCGKEMFNPNLGNYCLSWCDKAVECLGDSSIEEWKKRNISSGI